jgi:DNA polymerase-3 subunit epsilon
MPFKRFFQPAKEYAPYYQDYQALFADPLPLSTPIEALRFVVFDTETTGLNPRKDRLLSIGAVTVHAGNIPLERSFDREVGQIQRVAPQEEAIAVHGILPHHATTAAPEQDIIAEFMAYLGDAIVVAHHVKFDVLMIEQALKQYGGGPLLNRRLDTVHLAQRAQRAGQGTTKAYNLDALARQYGIPLHDRHTAAGDAYITAVLLLKLLRRLQQRGVTTLRDLLRG